MSDEEDALGNEDKEQDQIRAELSQISFEDLQKLKEKLGVKVYKETLFGPRKVKQVDFKRENKNRPRELSAKKPISRFREVIQVKKNIPRDPRFDSLCGTFDKKRFNKAYSFLSDVKKNDLEKLKKKLKGCNDPKQIKKIKYLVKRLENQLNEEKRQNQKEEKKYEEKKEIVEAIKRGKKPTFKKKSEKRVLDLISQYEELKSTGKLKKHIKRLRKKNLQKDRQKLASVEHE
ncbi:PREDICTED: ribosomal RNA processing protein 36 homolog [Eufriesea mexicana]|uniref:ribosomal RNA processing protein 36 homolog n=1 Tax=Eufriesea mexicana TaxID=516756 RepID=UPI00083BF0DF|nr:PREDICTED: ribosomal RNA processing protein 36 homolog [Eufriesea mexicana]